MSEKKASEGISEVLAQLDATLERVKNDPEYLARVEAEAERERAERAERDAWEARAQLARRGIPDKDHARLLSRQLRSTRAMVLAAEFLTDRDARILVLSGGGGCGKTTAAAWLVSQQCPDVYFDRERYRATPTWPDALHPRFLDVTTLARLSGYKAETMEPLEQCSMLALDDLGMEYADAKGYFSSLLDGLINVRYHARLRTVITTNVPAEDQETPKGKVPGFKSRYSGRIAERIRECGRFVEIAEPSLRGRP